MQEELEHYFGELLVIGFKSSKYGLNIIIEYLFQRLKEAGDPVEIVIKRGGNFVALKTKTLKSLDISNYLPPGYSYEKFLNAHELCTQ